MPEFEVFRKRMAPLVKDPFVTIQRRGVMSLNAAAYAALGSPSAVELLFDPKERIVGLRATEENSEHAYPVRSTSSKRESTFMVSGTAFTKFYGIDTTESVRRRAVLENGVLCVDLNDAGTTIVGNRSKADTQRGLELSPGGVPSDRLHGLNLPDERPPQSPGGLSDVYKG